jgi:leader peptidase (prepilin peptidase) / N-methyltransferase
VSLGMALLSGFALVIGLCVGSFLNVCIHRIPMDLSVVRPASRCPSCGHAIRPRDNIPVLSWLLLRGRCRDCGTPISSIYPAIELLTGIVAWLLFRRVIPSEMDLDWGHLGLFVLYFGLAAALIADAFIDLRYQIIPFELSVYLVPLFVGGWALLDYAGIGDVGFKGSVLGALFGGGAFAFLGLLWRVLFRKQAVGGGDIYLSMMIGAGIGAWPALPYVLVLASLIGSVIGIALVFVRRAFFGVSFPFGPPLALATISYLIHGPLGAERYFADLQWLFSPK